MLALVAMPPLARYVFPTIPVIGVMLGWVVNTRAWIAAATVAAKLLAMAKPNRPVAVTSRTRLPELVGTTVVPLPITLPDSSQRRLYLVAFVAVPSFAR